VSSRDRQCTSSTSCSLTSKIYFVSCNRRRPYSHRRYGPIHLRGHRSVPARVQDKERVFCIHHFRTGTVLVRIPPLPRRIEFHLACGSSNRRALFPTQDNEVLNGRCVDDRFLDDMHERDCLAPPDCHIRRDINELLAPAPTIRWLSACAPVTAKDHGSGLPRSGCRQAW